MKTISLQDALHQQPFKPFVIHLDGGKEVNVRHPDFLLFSESRQTVVVVEGEHFHILDVEHISSLSY